LHLIPRVVYKRIIFLDFSNIGEWVEIGGALELCRDPDDNKFLEVAVKANATMLVSGDRDLTDMKNIEGIPIYTPLNKTPQKFHPRK
jgi:predicted nucleic acid-binding protein